MSNAESKSGRSNTTYKHQTKHMGTHQQLDLDCSHMVFVCSSLGLRERQKPRPGPPLSVEQLICSQDLVVHCLVGLAVMCHQLYFGRRYPSVSNISWDTKKSIFWTLNHLPLFIVVTGTCQLCGHIREIMKKIQLYNHCFKLSFFLVFLQV